MGRKKSEGSGAQILAGLGPIQQEAEPQLSMQDEVDAKRQAEIDALTSALEQAVADEDRKVVQQAELERGGAFRDVIKDILESKLGWRNYELPDGRKVSIGKRTKKWFDREKAREFFKAKDAKMENVERDGMSQHVFQQEVVIRMRDLSAAQEIIALCQRLRERDPNLIATHEEIFDEGTIEYYIDRQMVSKDELMAAEVYHEEPNSYLILPKPPELKG
jgi:hypothetical protein